MDKLTLMQVFVTIVDEGSLTAAARSLGKSPPAVVRSLALLEEHLGVRLLNRTTRSMALTHEGTAYLERCRQVLSDIAETEAGLRGEDASPRGLVRVTASVRYGQLRVAPSVGRFLERFPDVQVELVLLDRVVHLVEEGFDVGVRIAPLGSSSLVATKVGVVRRMVVGSPALLARQGRPRRPEALAELPTVPFRRDDARVDQFHFVRDGKPFDVPVHGAFATNDTQACIGAMVAGLGFGQVLSYQVEDLVSAGALVPVLERYAPPPIPVSLVFPHRRLLSPRTRALVDWLQRDLAPTRTARRGRSPRTDLP